MKIPTKFQLNLEDYKVYFDNDKKTYVCEDIETGEKTNVGVIGTFLQMGIIKTIEDNSTNPDERVAYLMDKVVSLERKLGGIVEESEVVEVKVEEKKSKKSENPKEAEVKGIEEEEPEKPERKPILKKHKPKKQEEEDNSIKERVMEKIIEKTMEEESEQKPPEDVKVESDEEIDNWMEI